MLAIVLVVPGTFGTDWSVMARIDLGQVLLVVAALRVLDGVIRTGRWARGSARVLRPSTAPGVA